MKRKLQLKKEMLRTLSAEHLEQVAGGSNNGTLDGCDALAPNVFCLLPRPIYPLPTYPFRKL